MRSLSILAIGISAYRAMAQTATFDGMTWDPVTVGQVWPIHWTVGDGSPVDLILGNTSWNSAVFTAQPANPPEFNWTVTVPDGFVAGNYGLVLIQSDGMDYSPLFSIAFSAAASSTTPSAMPSTTPAPTPMPNATLVSASAEPTVTVTYWDHECGCTKTSAVSAATATNLPGTQYTWWDDSCGCTKTAMAPVPTVAPGCNGSGSGCSNYTAPAAGTNVPPAPPSSMAPAASTTTSTPYTGQASRQMSSGVAIVGLFVVAAALLA
ncbi:hypothetical protein A1O3_07586 [Capronia epimyces CBS 606.96]|uniref:Uncharacterized protein n=1 Tax=Capronia epimyces CBS 606.96 TaxID=1182542 RepID=W9XWB6_9EURO|nr:uncharacterized protein A1O3_07586 [Capronia epimyces CBS 606.96]EXJ81296.1 hypothetical protein A1O3_07586 [Capronia epimyces CBS 606.96]